MTENERGIRTELLNVHKQVVGRGHTWGEVVRWEHACPCGRGLVVRDRDYIAGFQGSSRYIECEHCRASWDFVPGLSVSGWRLEPKTG